MRVSFRVIATASVILGSGHQALAAGNVGAGAVRLPLVSITRSTAIPIGDQTVNLTVTDTGTDVTFIRVHQNEMPAGAVGRRINSEVPSRFVDLAHRGTREIAFALDGRQHSFDPNRIFSPGVPPASLGSGLVPSGTQATRALADALTSLLLPDVPVMALHNHRGTLLQSYASGPLKTCTHAVYVNTQTDPSTFAVVSTKSLFDAIKHLEVSVVWENRVGPHNDGSLLAYAQRHHIAYINVEAAQGAPVETQLGVVRRIVAAVRDASLR